MVLPEIAIARLKTVVLSVLGVGQDNGVEDCILLVLVIFEGEAVALRSGEDGLHAASVFVLLQPCGLYPFLSLQVGSLQLVHLAPTSVLGVLGAAGLDDDNGLLFYFGQEALDAVELPETL